MSRSYTRLECGCFISCDGGGGLIPVCDGKNCKVKEYLKEHKSDGYYCPICHPYEYLEEKNERMGK